MRVPTKLSLTLLSAVFLTACGGGDAPASTPVNSSQVTESPKTEDNSTTPKEDNTSKAGENNTQNQSEDTAKEEDNTPKPSEDKPQSQPESEKNATAKEENNTPKPSENEPQPTSNPVETAPPLTEDTTPKKPDEIVTNVIDQTDSFPPDFDDYYLIDGPAPSEPIRIKSHEEIFGKFTETFRADSSASSYLVNIQLDGKEIQLIPANSNVKINDHMIHTLVDQRGQLLGHYGYAVVHDRKEAKDYHVLPYEMDPNEKGRPSADMQYAGQMHYFYLTTPTEALTADVSGIYSNTNKTLSLQISADGKERGKHWELAPTAVGWDGKVFGKLFNGKVPAGEFDGGLYGRNGEVLTGKTKFENENNKEEEWKGVIGAKALEK